jgi:hypothetical protein
MQRTASMRIIGTITAGIWRCASPVLRRAVRFGLILAVIILFVLGPWPADNSGFRGSSYEQSTLREIESTAVLNSPLGTIRVGIAEVDISPPPGHPLAGYSARKTSGYTEIDTRCYARALTISSGDTQVTILTADLLLINAKLAAAVLERTRLPAGQVYFTATHTHSGPGAWGDHPIEKLVTGSYDPLFFRSLADKLAEVVTRSREVRVPVEFGVASMVTRYCQSNRVEREAPLDDRLVALVFREIPAAGEKPPVSPLAVLTIFSAHATVCSSANNNLNADYPGYLVTEVRKKSGCPNVLFAAGAVGEAAPAKFPAGTEAEAARLLGHLLADDVNKLLADVVFQRRIPLAVLRSPVQLPEFRFPISSGWRVSPICSSWISDRRTHLHAVRIGPAVLVGFPGDYSGRLAAPLIEWCANRGFTAMTTSFNGDYKGYLVPERTFMSVKTYETREMNFFGPWAGEYLAEMSLRMVEKLIPEGNSP